MICNVMGVAKRAGSEKLYIFSKGNWNYIKPVIKKSSFEDVH